MNILVGMDSIYIQVINIKKYQRYFNEFYSTNNIILFPVEDVNDNLCIKRVTTTDNTKLTLFYSIHTGDIQRFTYNTYTTFKFTGLISYDNNKDIKRTNILLKFIDLLTSLDIEYRITTINISFDMKVDKKKSIENFLPIRVGTTTKVNNPFNYFKSTLYVESDKVIKPSVKSYVYDKTIKEKIDEKIIRFEVSIRNVKKVDNDFESVLNHISNYLLNYKLYYFESKSKCDKVKRKYRDNIKKENRKNFPISLQKESKKLDGQEIELVLYDDVLNILKQFFNKKDKLITIERKTPQWLKFIPNRSKKEIKKVVKFHKIPISYFFFYLIPISLIYVYQSNLKKGILTLTNRFTILSISPLLLRVFLPTNKSPPITNLYQTPYWD